MRAILLLALLAACSEYRVDHGPKTQPVDPAAAPLDEQGSPPDWQTCRGGYYGLYFNLSGNDPRVGPDADPAPADPSGLDWWSRDDLAFQRYDPSIDFGDNWWPVDEGLQDDPRYFTTEWTAWVRVWSRTDMRVLLGAADDAWVLVDDEVVASVADSPDLEASGIDVRMSPGQYPVKILFAHRNAMAASFRFRVTDGDVTFCYPDFSSDTGQ